MILNLIDNFVIFVVILNPRYNGNIQRFYEHNIETEDYEIKLIKLYKSN